MRVNAIVTELDEDRWDVIQKAVNTSYDIQKGATRVCVTFVHGELERHAEMPLGVFTGLMVSLGLTGVVSNVCTAMAALQPDADQDEDDKNTRPEGADQ
jgi:hypothetical protein